MQSKQDVCARKTVGMPVASLDRSLLSQRALLSIQCHSPRSVFLQVPGNLEYIHLEIYLQLLDVTERAIWGEHSVKNNNSLCLFEQTDN